MEKLLFLKVLFYIKSITSYLKRLNAPIYQFIWGSKWERIRRLNLACSVEMGGAKMLHLPFFVSTLQWKHLQHFFHQRFISVPL